MLDKKVVLQIRSAKPEDADLAAAFMHKLGEYQKMSAATTVTPQKMERLLADGCGEAVFGMLENKAVAFLYFYSNSSAFIGEKSIYIDGFYVEEEYRGCGVGTQMMQYMARLAIERGCGRLEWGCLDWNEPALGFYKQFGAKGIDTMTIYRLTPDKIETLAHRDEA